MLASSQGKADSSLLNFSRWQIKQAVADCPWAERAGLEPPAALGGGCLLLPCLPAAVCAPPLRDSENLRPVMWVLAVAGGAATLPGVQADSAEPGK